MNLLERSSKEDISNHHYSVVMKTTEGASIK